MSKVYMFNPRDIEAENELSYQAMDIFREFYRIIEEAKKEMIDQKMPLDKISMELGVQVKDEAGDIVAGVMHSTPKIVITADHSHILELAMPNITIKRVNWHDNASNDGITVTIKDHGLDQALKAYGYRYCKEQICNMDEIVQKEEKDVR